MRFIKELRVNKKNFWSEMNILHGSHFPFNSKLWDNCADSDPCM